MKLKQTDSNRATSPSKWLVAFLFIVAGGLLFARNFGLVTPVIFNILFSWQMLLILFGLYACIRRHFFSGLMMLIIGLGFGLPKLGFAWLPANPVNTIIWPAILILIGLFIIFRPRRQSHTIHHDRNSCCGGTKQNYHSADGVLRSDNVFGGVHHVVLDEVFKGGVINNTFGGTAIDLRRTRIEGAETYIDVDNSWGGIELYVPSEWNVVIRCNAFMGACEDKRWKTPSTDTQSVLVIRGKVSFGGIEIKD